MPTRSSGKRSAPKQKSEWQRRHEYAWLREPGLADEELPTPAWHRPLEGHSASDVLYQHADPLRALHAGRVPAVVKRLLLLLPKAAAAPSHKPSAHPLCTLLTAGRALLVL